MNGHAGTLPYSTINNSIYDEEGSYSLFLLLPKKSIALSYERKGYLMKKLLIKFIHNLQEWFFHPGFTCIGTLLYRLFGKG